MCIIFPPTQSSLEFLRLRTNQQPYNQPKKPQHTTEDLNHQHLHKQRAVCRVRERSTGSIDAHAHAADQVAHADRDAGPEERVAGIVVGASVELFFRDVVELGREDDGHDDAIYGDDFAEDDGNEVFCADAGRFNAAADDGGAGYEDAPIGRGESWLACVVLCEA